MDLTGKAILVTGGTGLIGRELVELLIKKNPAFIRIASLDHLSCVPEGCDFYRADLRDPRKCKDVVHGIDVVFHLMGIKGSPKMSKERPADFFVPLLQCNTNMMDAAFREDVEWYLYTSSVGVYQPADVMRESDVWKTMPSQNDWYPGWAKRIGELQADVYAIQHGWRRVSIVRPANVYGRYDNYDPNNAMVIPSLIRRVVDGENPLSVWGDGTPIRDFIHARDVAAGMIHMVERSVTEPVNLGSGTGVSIKELVETLVDISKEKPPVVWDSTKPKGDAMRLFDMTVASEHGFHTTVSLREGLEEVYWFYKNPDNREVVAKRYNVFTERR
jgi:GDP-L-fucose synthase